MKQDTYWSIVLEPGWVQGAVWDIEEDQTAKVLAVGKPSSWSSEAELITAVDTTLSSTIQAVSDESEPEPQKAVFGLSPAWVTGGEIKDEHLVQIKKICTKLALEPTGFVVLPEAIAHYFKSEEGSPLSAVVIGISEAALDVSVFRLGRLVGSISVTRSVSLVEDVVEGLARFGKGEPLPSRFLIYNLKEGELEEARQALTDTDWQLTGDKVSFLHTPKIETVNSQTKLVAVCLAGASEMSKATSASLVDQKKKEKGSEPLPANLDTHQMKPEELGFAVGADVGPAATPAMAGGPASISPSGTPVFKRIKSFFASIFTHRPSFPGMPNLAGKIPLIGGILLAVLLIAFFLIWWFLPKATVTVFVAPQKLEASEAVVLSSKTSSLSDKLIPVAIVKTQASGEKEAETTGVKTVGEKSKGKVTIQNGTDTAIRLSAGATIASSGSLKFTLDDSASIPERTAPDKPGEVTNIAVTAADIGSDYNLAKDEAFSVSNYPKTQVAATAEEGFAGGTSQEIASVSEKDRQNLEEDLTDDLIKKATSELEDQVGSESIFVKDAAQARVLSREFNQKVGDEAENLKLTLEVEVSALAVKRSDLEAFAQEKLASQVPEGFVLRGNQIKSDFKIEEEDSGEWPAEVSFVVNLLPEINPEEIAREIAGKYRSLAEERLKRVPGFIRAEITIKPQFPDRLGTLPRIAKRISVEVSSGR